MKINYLNNRDLLEEIHLSKNTYCSFEKPEYHRYDIIVPDLEKINIRTIADAKRNKAKRLSTQDYERRRAHGEKIKQADCEIDYRKIPKEELIFRVMTFDHIPLNATRKKNPKTVADGRDKVNFPPFQHWKFDENDQLVCVGKSHWKGDLKTGEFCKDHGQLTNNLARMYIMLCERYATRGNVRNYCVDTETEALTMRGWLNIDQITEDDKILSFHRGSQRWSRIKSIYRGEYDGLMHKITSNSVDFFVTPEHKILTRKGLIKAELIRSSDRIITNGRPIDDPISATYTDEFVEVAARILSNGTYHTDNNNLTITANFTLDSTEKIALFRKSLYDLNYDHIERQTDIIQFEISTLGAKKIASVFPNCEPTLDFVLSLTKSQREKFLKSYLNYNPEYFQKSVTYQIEKNLVNVLGILITLCGRRCTTTPCDDGFYTLKMSVKQVNVENYKNLNFNGGERMGSGVEKLTGKENFPNVPIAHYKGRVWCPETEFGCFFARRSGKIHLTGNTYNDEMRGQAILQLTKIGLQFDESKSDNPFSYFTAAVTNSFVRIINLEKRNQNIRDDLLEISGMSPSYTRTSDTEYANALKRFESSGE